MQHIHFFMDKQRNRLVVPSGNIHPNQHLGKANCKTISLAIHFDSSLTMKTTENLVCCLSVFKTSARSWEIKILTTMRLSKLEIVNNGRLLLRTVFMWEFLDHVDDRQCVCFIGGWGKKQGFMRYLTLLILLTCYIVTLRILRKAVGHRWDSCIILWISPPLYWKYETQ